MRNARLLAGVLVLCAATTAAAQGLADVARAEQERRKAAGKASKVYTNENLKAELPPSPPPSPPAAPASAALAATAAPASLAAVAPVATDAGSGGSAVAAAEAKPALPAGEAGWRAKAAELRGAVVRQQILADALQSRINALRTDFVNRDDPAQRAVIETDRGKALAELDRVRKDLKAAELAVKDIDEQARKQGVPAGWVR